MENARIDRLTKRIEDLEKNNKRLLIMLAGVLVLMVFSFAAKAPDSLAARRFALVDGTGAVRAELALREGQPGLFLKDETEKDRVELVHDRDQSALFIRDDKETIRIGVAQFSHGGGGFALHGPDSKGGAVLYFKKDGSLRFFDPEGVVTDQIPTPKAN